LEEAVISGANSFKFVLLPPQTDTTRDWAKRLAEIVPEAHVIVAEDGDTAAREIVDAEAAFGWLGSDLLLKATKLRWLQAPQAAPPAGYYYPELIAHSVVVTNFREIFNDHIGAPHPGFSALDLITYSAPHKAGAFLADPLLNPILTELECDLTSAGSLDEGKVLLVNLV
jgi:hypothetical protein